MFILCLTADLVFFLQDSDTHIHTVPEVLTFLLWALVQFDKETPQHFQ